MHATVGMMRWLFIASIGTGIFAFVYAVAATPSRVASRLGLRGLKRQRELANNQSWAQVEPLVRWLGVRVSGALSDEMWSKLDEAIALAGDFMGITPEELIAMSILSGIGVSVFGFALGYMGHFPAGIIAVLGFVVGAALPILSLNARGESRLKAVNRTLPAAIDLIALSMSAGLDFPNAVKQVVEKSSDPDSPIVEEMTMIMQELKLGRTRKQALQEFERRAPSDSVKEFVGAVVQAEERGNPLVETLQIQAETARQRRTVRAEESAAKAGVQMVMPLVFLLLAIMMLIMAPIVLRFKDNLPDKAERRRITMTTGLKFFIRQPDGRVEQLAVESDRVLIGSAGHCEIRLPLDQAKPEHVLLQVTPTGVYAQARAFDPQPTLNGVPFTQTVVMQNAVLGVGLCQITIEATELLGAQGGSDKGAKDEKKLSPVTYVGVAIAVPALVLILTAGGGDNGPGPPPTKVPELWGPVETQCPQKNPDAAFAYARDQKAMADGKRERRPFRVQEGVAAVPLYERAAACFRVSGGANAAYADECSTAAKKLRASIAEDYRTHQVRLEYARSREYWPIAQHEVTVLLAMLDGKQGEYVTWLSNLDRSLRVKYGKGAK